MKVAAMVKALCLCVVLMLAGSAEGAREDKTIAKVVKLLQKMLDESKKDAESDKAAYGKYACYVAQNKAEKEESIESLTKEIALLESSIEELQSTNAELSLECATLQRNMGMNEATQKQATAVRKSSKEAFEGEEKDFEAGIDQMKEAIDVLSSIGLPQTGTKAKKKAFLMNLDVQVKEALTSASALLPPAQRRDMEALLQSPSAGVADAGKEGGIVTILKTFMKTFKTNLKNAQDSDEAEEKAYKESMKTLEDSYKKMKKSYDDKQEDMGENDESLGSKKVALDSATKQKASDEEFLEKLLEMSAKKEKDYEERKMLRTNEDAAIAETISILNSDEAFETFGKTGSAAAAAGSSASSFLQVVSRRSLTPAGVRVAAENALLQAGSKRLGRVVAKLRGGNPFREVLDEIDKMLLVIKEEGESDKTQYDWCIKERKNKNADLESEKKEIKKLEGEIDGLDKDINDPVTGLIQQISDKEEAIVDNQKEQKDATETRKEEHVAFVENVANLDKAEDIMAKAINVLKRYYDALDEQIAKGTGQGTFVQIREDPDPPSTYDAYDGQKNSGAKALEMLNFILTETEKENAKAKADEKKSQEDYDQEMTDLKKAETEMGEQLVKLKETLASKEKKLAETKVELKDTIASKESIEKYLEKIKPGCDFIDENFDLREENRKTEKEALNKAIDLIKATPAYKTAETKAQDECKSECNLDKTGLDCKACLSGSDKKEYCEGHPGTPGCKMVS